MTFWTEKQFLVLSCMKIIKQFSCRDISYRGQNMSNNIMKSICLFCKNQFTRKNRFVTELYWLRNNIQSSLNRFEALRAFIKGKSGASFYWQHDLITHGQLIFTKYINCFKWVIVRKHILDDLSFSMRRWHAILNTKIYVSVSLDVLWISMLRTVFLMNTESEWNMKLVAIQVFTKRHYNIHLLRTVLKLYIKIYSAITTKITYKVYSCLKHHFNRH